MSRAKRIIRFTFWSNMGVWLLLMLEMGSFIYRLPLVISLIAALVLVLALGLQGWTLKRRYGVTKTTGMYFTDDERERTIAYQVHSSCLAFLTQGLLGLLVVVFLLLLAGMTSGVQLGTWTLGLGFLILFISNCQYYYLWQKYDPA